MGVDISFIIKNDFMQTRDRRAAEAYARKTFAQLKEYFKIGDDEYSDSAYDGPKFICSDDEIYFRLHGYEVDIYLHNGYWQVEPYFHYNKLTEHFDDYFWIRRQAYDLAKALRQDEAWYAEEYYTWNGGTCDRLDDTFQEWLENVTGRYGKPVPEFDQAAIMATGDEYFEPEPIYHDSFAECRALHETLQSKFGPCRILGIMRFGDDQLRCEKDGALMLIKENM